MHASTSADGARGRGARPLPQGRAVVGGLLVVAAVAVAGVATRSDANDHRRPYVTAAVDLDVGHIIEIDDLATALLDLDDGVVTFSFAERDRIVGAVVLSPASAGELIQRSDLAPAALTDRRDRAAIEITFPVDHDRAPRSLQVGERVMVLATDRDGAEATTRVSAVDATVVDYATGDDGFAASSDAVVTLALTSTDDHVAVVHDTQVSDLTIIRSNRPVPSTAGLSSSVDDE